MPSKLTIINDELVGCGETPVAEADDGSPEWTVCSAAYDTSLDHLLDEHDWKFAKAITEIEDRTDSDDQAYDDAYDRPSGTLHIVKVMDDEGTPLDDWKILGDQILVNHDAGIMIERIIEPVAGEWPGLFLKALRHGVRAGIYRGLKKDREAADSEEKKIEFYLGKARPRGDSEQPGKARFVSTLATARRRRRG